MKVPFFETRRSSDEFFGLEAATARVVASGQYILGPEVDAFEDECAEFLGVKHAIGMSSGTDALLASLMAIGVGRGDEVIVPTFTFVATASAVVRLGARPVFVDSRPGDLTMSAAAVDAVTERTRAIIPVDLFGACSSTPPAFGVRTIRDSAQAFGSFFGGDDLACHSFFPTKNLRGFGDGGLITTGNAGEAMRLRALRNHGSSVRYRHDVIGGNFRLDALQAALLRVSLRSLPYSLTARRENAARYHNALGKLASTGRIALPPTPFNGVPNQFVIRVPDGRRDMLRAFLTACGVGSEVYYPTPLHLQPCFQSLGYAPGRFPVAELAAKEVLALPIFPGLREDEIAYVCETIRAFFR